MCMTEEDLGGKGLEEVREKMGVDSAFEIS